MSWDRLKAEIHKISDTLKNQSINFQEFMEHPKHLLSLSSQLSPLNACGKKNNFSIEAPTSGESSPCLSESGKTPRYFAPSVFDLTQLINQETFTEVDYNIEKHNDSSEKDLIMLILIEDLDPSITIEAFYNLLSEVKVNNYNHNDIFETKSPKFIKFKEKRCLSFKVKLKWPKLFARFIRKLQMHIKNSTGHAVKIGEAKLQPPAQNNKFLNGVVLRNLPPKLTGEELLHEINQNIQGDISVGSVKKVKEANCCVVECSYLEDAEVICKKMNKQNWQNPESSQSHIIKAHIYPHNTLKHKQREKSIFSDMFTFKPILKQKPAFKPKPKPNNLKKTEIRRLIDIFASSEKSTQESTQQTVFGNQNFLFHHEQDQFQSIKSFVYNLT